MRLLNCDPCLSRLNMHAACGIALQKLHTPHNQQRRRRTKTTSATHLKTPKGIQRPHAFHLKIASGSSRCACRSPCSHSHSILSKSSSVSSSLVDPAVPTVGDSHPLSPIKRPNRRASSVDQRSSHPVCRSTGGSRRDMPLWPPLAATLGGSDGLDRPVAER